MNRVKLIAHFLEFLMKKEALQDWAYFTKKSLDQDATKQGKTGLELILTTPSPEAWVPCSFVWGDPLEKGEWDQESQRRWQDIDLEWRALLESLRDKA